MSATERRAREAWLRLRQGVVITETATNLPRKPGLASDAEQAKWVDSLLSDNGSVSVAECSDGLTKAMRARGLHVTYRGDNPGGVGNAGVQRRKPIRSGRNRCSYLNNDGRVREIYMQWDQVRISKFIRHTHFHVHIPSTGQYDTSARPDQKAECVRKVARAKCRTRSRSASGDWNMPPHEALRYLRQVDKRWDYLGGEGVEATFGIRCHPIAEEVFLYGNRSDHHATARCTFGVRGRLV